MASLLSFQPYQARIHLPNQTRIHLPTQTRIRTRFTGSLFHLRGSVGLTRVNSSHFHHQLDEILYTLADATSAVQDAKPKEDWFTGIASYMEIILKILKDGLSTLHVPYAYGFAIILLTILVKAATFPLTKKQVESAIAMRSLQPQVKSIQKRFAGDQERIQIETARLYKLAGVNPLAGCLPTLLTIPVWIGLYRALSNVANEGLLSEGFFWIPSLAGPTTIAKSSGISWLFPFIDGEPPLGWSDTFAYLVLPTLLIISQYISTQVMQASQPQSDDQSQQSAQVITKFLPLLIGYFALSVPSGLSLYWLTNNILSTTQQIWLQKLGGAKNPVKDYMEKVSKDDKSPIIDISKPNIEISNPNFEDSNSDLVPRGERFKQIKEKDADERGKRFRQLKEEEARKKKQKEQEKMTQNETNNDNNNININNMSLKEELNNNNNNNGNNNNGNNNIKDDTNNLNGSSLKDIIATEQINELQDQETKKDDA